MKKVTVTGPALTIASGRVELTAAQAAPRMHNLTIVSVDEKGAGVFEVKAPIQFKHNETIGYDGTVGKDGVVSDPDAAQRPGESQEDAVTRVRAELGPQIGQELREELRASMTPGIEAQLRAELEPKIRAELEERLAAEQRVQRGAAGQTGAPAAPHAVPGATGTLNLGAGAAAPAATPAAAQQAPIDSAEKTGTHHGERTAHSPDKGRLDDVKSKK